jgi:hypothetical protein
MTLIALRTTDRCAEILVDTLSYGIGDAEFLHCGKVRAMPYADLAIAGKGAGEFAALAALLVDGQPSGAPHLDAVDELLRRELPELWADIEGKEGRRAASWIYLVGWSPNRQRFVALEYDSDTDFIPTEVGHDVAFSNPIADGLQTPNHDDDWITLGNAVYEQNSLRLDRSQQTIIGGGLILTRIERGSTVQRRIHDLPEDDWRFRQMLIGTVHDYGQIGPCICGSGQPYLLCHLPSFAPDWPCPCLSGKPFAECHRLNPADPKVFTYWTEHPEDFHRTKAGLREAWDRQFPDEPRFDPPEIIKPDQVARALPPGLLSGLLARRAADPSVPPPAVVLQSRAERRRAARQTSHLSKKGRR